MTFFYVDYFLIGKVFYTYVEYHSNSNFYYHSFFMFIGLDELFSIFFSKQHFVAFVYTYNNRKFRLNFKIYRQMPRHFNPLKYRVGNIHPDESMNMQMPFSKWLSRFSSTRELCDKICVTSDILQRIFLNPVYIYFSF